jgi:HicB_like antitoxin of bacterial toxin-antitoxin system
MAVEALAFHVDGMREDGDAIPPPSPMDAIMASSRNRNAIAFLVDLPAKSRRAVRINVSLPEDVMQSIDRVAANRSRFLADVARERLQRQRKSA